MEIKVRSIFIKMKIEHKICDHCGATMLYNELMQRWECKLCGNAIELNATFGLHIPRMIS